METLCAALMIVIGLIAIILMIVSVIYPEWFTHRHKRMAHVISPVMREEIEKSNKELE